MPFSLQSKAGELLKDKVAVEVLEKYVPGLTKNPMIALAKGKTLEKIVKMPQAKKLGLTEEMVTRVLDEINAKKK